VRRLGAIATAAGSVAEEILDEARRAISVQVSSLDELRSRTGLLLAASSLSGSFLGSAAVHNTVGFEFWGGLAVVAFAAAIGSCIKALWPVHNAWKFVASPTQLKMDWIDIDRGEQSMAMFLADYLESCFRLNKERLDCLYIWFQVAAIAVGVEVIAGSLQLATGG
jgi:hypothetical protein